MPNHTKHVDLKNRIIDYYDVDTANVEDEIIQYLDKQMKVRFHSAQFNNKKYVFVGKPSDYSNGSITISGYRLKKSGENVSIMIG